MCMNAYFSYVHVREWKCVCVVFIIFFFVKYKKHSEPLNLEEKKNAVEMKTSNKTLNI